MEYIKYNKENITEESIERKVEKARSIILNEEGKALVIKYAGLYMFPGGKIEENEEKEEALKRELLEETGIEKVEFEKEPFLIIESYEKDYYDRKLKRNINRQTKTYFYSGTTKEEIDKQKQELTQSEKDEEFLAEFKNLSIIEYLVENNQSGNKKQEVFDREIITAINELKKYKQKNKEIEK